MWTSSRYKAEVRRGSKIALIIAHPDDEAMFFAPFLISSNFNYCKVSIICLSTGNFDGLGSTRKNELLKCADCHNIDRNHVHIIDHENLQDGKESNWSPDLIKDVVLSFLVSEDFDAVRA